MGRVGVVLRCLVRLLGIEGERRLRCVALVGSLVGGLAAKSPCVTLSKQVVSISFCSCLIISSMRLLSGGYGSGKPRALCE